MLHHVLTFTKAEDFSQAVAEFGAFKGVDLQATINSTTSTMRVSPKEEADQAILEAFLEDCSNASIDLSLHHEEVSTTADLLDEVNKLQNENAKLQSELTNLQNDNAKLQNENAKLQSELTNLQNDNAKLQSENAKLQK